MLNVVRSLSPALTILLSMVEVTATAVLSGGGKAGSICEELCQQIPSPAGVCKAFTRALPRPKLGRTCEKKFGEGWEFACSFLCSREEDSLYHPWIDRLTHRACQGMSGHIPYPAVFNSCKTGYRNGLITASAAVSKRLGQKWRSDAIDGNIFETHGSENYPEINAEQLQHQEEASTGQIGDIVAESKMQTARTESAARVPEEDVEALTESWGTPQEYVDYNAIAQGRVTTARRTRGSDVSRGPACPVCSG